LLALAVPLFAAHASGAYSHVAQYISELGARGAAHGALVSFAGFAATGACVLAFLLLSLGVFPRSRLSRAGIACLSAVGVAYLVSAVFRCDPGCPNTGSLAQSIHNVFGLLEYLGAVSGLLLMAAALREDAEWESLSGVSVAFAALVALGLAGMLAPPLEAMRGVSQRIAESGIFGWIACASLRMLR
jgi:hypothetical protein